MNFLSYQLEWYFLTSVTHYNIATFGPDPKDFFFGH